MLCLEIWAVEKTLLYVRSWQTHAFAISLISVHKSFILEVLEWDQVSFSSYPPFHWHARPGPLSPSIYHVIRKTNICLITHPWTVLAWPLNRVFGQSFFTLDSGEAATDTELLHSLKLMWESWDIIPVKLSYAEECCGWDMYLLCLVPLVDARGKTKRPNIHKRSGGVEIDTYLDRHLTLLVVWFPALVAYLGYFATG